MWLDLPVLRKVDYAYKPSSNSTAWRIPVIGSALQNDVIFQASRWRALRMASASRNRPGVAQYPAGTGRARQTFHHLIASLIPQCPVVSTTIAIAIAAASQLPSPSHRRHIEKCHCISSEWLGPNFPTLPENVSGMRRPRRRRPDERGSMRCVGQARGQAY